MGKKKGTRCLCPFLKLLPGHLVCMSTPPSCRFSKFISQRELAREEMWGRSGKGEAGLIVDLGINSIDNNNKRHYSSNAKYSPNIVRDISAAFVLLLATILKVGVTSPILSTEKNWGPEILNGLAKFIQMNSGRGNSDGGLCLPAWKTLLFWGHRFEQLTYFPLCLCRGLNRDAVWNRGSPSLSLLPRGVALLLLVGD